MSGFFTLGGKEEEQDQETTTYNNNSLYLFRNEEIYNKGFELWQQYYQLHHHHQQQQQKLQLEDHHHVDLSLIGGSSSSSSRRLITTNYINLSTTDDDNQSLLLHNNYSSRSSSLGFGLMRQSGGGGNNNNNIGISSSSSISMNCQDCGNQAKKDCEHMRCRTCCKSRGFQCKTHVKSTWVPAAKRRERQQHLHLISSKSPPLQHQNQQQLSLNPKRQRDNSNPLASTTLPTHTSASGLEMGQFPAEVISSALFRCVNVRAMDDADEQYAYQTSVSIGGHVFKGLLYDQGPESRHGGGVGETCGGGSVGRAQQPLNLITVTTNAATTGATTSNPPGVTWLDPSSYPTPLNAFMAGTQFFPPPEP